MHNEWTGDLRQDTQPSCFLRALCCPLVDGTAQETLPAFGITLPSLKLSCLFNVAHRSEVGSKARVYTYLSVLSELKKKRPRTFFALENLVCVFGFLIFFVTDLKVDG